MALKVWLPLNGNLDNNGTGYIGTPSLNTMSYSNAGKIGACSGTGKLGWHLVNDILDNEWTIALWFKNTSAFSQYNNIFFCKNYTSSNDCQIYFSTINGTSLNIGVNGPSTSYNLSYTFNLNTWYHVAATYDGNTVTLYVNGSYLGSSTVTTAKPTGKLNININGRAANETNTSTTGEMSACRFNDIRLYDECLSAKEIKEISRALVLHYKLDERNNKNLIVNGFGNDGTENWTGTSSNYYSTTEIPPTSLVTGVKASFFNHNSTIEHVAVDPTHTYTISAYLKCRTSSTTYIYPSIFPYDIDDKFIYYYNEPEGFWTNTSTTLAQDLNPGDTIIYATDLSQWNANSGHYGNECSIFNYRDSTGHVYPDFTYTQNIGVFGSSTTEKTNINKTNNTITLRYAYNGQFVPAGTTICQSTEGSTYYYPFGGMALNTLTDWTFKTATLRPQNRSRLKYAKYWTFMAYGDCYYAGIKLIDNTLNTGLISDSSGYNNYGKIYGDLESSFDTVDGRYSSCALLDGVTDCVVIPYNKVCPENIFTSNIWFKKDSVGSKGYETLWGGPSGFEMDTRAGTAATMSLYMASTRGGALFSPLNFGQWYMITMVRDDTNEMYYVNGELKKTIEAKPMPTGTYYIGAWQTAEKQNYYGLLSDFRLYNTVLSETDIKELYNNPANIDNLGRVHGFEFNEEKLNVFNPINEAVNNKTWTNGLNRYQQSNCQVTLTDNGVRIYRTPNVNPTDDGNTMWGGIRLINSTVDSNHIYNPKIDNVWGLQKGHSYIWTFHVKGKSNNAPGFTITNQLGWGGGGLDPVLSNTVYSGITTDFNGEKDCFIKFTINDDVVKTCTRTYSNFTEGNKYLSYKHFGWNFQYTATGEWGTDLYITDFRLYDITDIDNKHLYKNGVIDFTAFDEKDYYIPSIRFDKELLSTGVIEK